MLARSRFIMLAAARLQVLAASSVPPAARSARDLFRHCIA